MGGKRQVQKPPAKKATTSSRVPPPENNAASPTIPKEKVQDVADKTLLEIELSLVTPSVTDDHTPPNVVCLPAQTFKKLGVFPGELVGLVGASSGVQAYLVAVLSSKVGGGSAMVAAATLSQLSSKTAVVSSARKKSPRWARSLALVSLDPTPMEHRVITASFRREYRHTTVFDGMILELYFASKAFHFQVDLEEDDAVFVADSLTVECLTGADDVDELSQDEEESSAPEMSVINYLLSELAATTRHVLLTGPRGCGKTFLLNTIRNGKLKEIQGRIQNLHVLEIISSSNPPERFASSCAQCRSLATAKSDGVSPLLLIDDLQMLFGEEARLDQWQSSHMLLTVLEQIDLFTRAGFRVVAAVDSDGKLPASVTRAGRLDYKMELQPPGTPVEREEFLRSLLSVFRKEGFTFQVDSATIQQVGKKTNGFTVSDLRELVERSFTNAFERGGSILVRGEDLQLAAAQVRPSALKSIDFSVPKVSWSDIGGSETAKQMLRQCVAWCVGEGRELFERFKMTPPRGVLLYGPPGCSKTLLAKALANESGMNFVSIKGPEVFSKWVGDSEKAVRSLFARARSVAPCVVFIDELDGMCSHRGKGGVSDRVISQFLTELDGLPSAISSKSDSIMLVAATNRPENIDPAVLRPGRIDRKVYVGLPALDERTSILSIGLSGMPVASTVSTSSLANQLDGYTGAEIIAVCKEAAFHAIAVSPLASEVHEDDFEAAVQKVRPRVSEEDVQWYQGWGAKTV